MVIRCFVVKKLSTMTLVALLLVSLWPENASAYEKRVCANRMVKLVKLLCEGCLDFWGKDGKPAAPEGYFDVEGMDYDNRFDSLLKENENSSKDRDDVSLLDHPQNLDELVLACCLYRTCTYSTMTKYCCGKGGN